MGSTDSLPPGMRDVAVTTTAISSIDDGVLTYRGIPIEELAEHATFEEVVHLLWHGGLPDKGQLIRLREGIAAATALPAGMIELMRAFPRRSTPMEVLRTAASALAMYDAESEDTSPAANLRKASRLLGQASAVVAAYDRIRNGREPVAPRPDLGFSANFFYMLRGVLPDPLHVRALDKAYILHAENELNASTLAARVAASALSDLHSCITAAIGTLKGTIHGGANEQVMRMLNEIGQPGNVEAYIRGKLASGERIMGFGHSVYKGMDPRARLLKDISRQLGKLTGREQWFEMSSRIEDLVATAKGLRPNIDFYSASVYHYLNLSPDLFTPIFAVSRTTGWVAHVLEQYANNRLIRPRATYTGPADRHWTTLDKR